MNVSSALVILLALAQLGQSKPTAPMEDPSEVRATLDLRSGQWDSAAWELWGPEVNRHAAFTDDGLRVTLPPPPGALKPLGVAARTTLVGDFQWQVQIQVPTAGLRSLGSTQVSLDAHLADGSRVRWTLMVAAPRGTELQARLMAAPGSTSAAGAPLSFAVKGSKFTMRLSRSGKAWRFAQSSEFVDDPAESLSVEGSDAPIERLQLAVEGSSHDKTNSQSLTIVGLSLQATRTQRTVIVIETADDRALPTTSLELHEGLLTLGGPGPEALPLKEVSRVTLQRSAPLLVTWRGQVDVDESPPSTADTPAHDGAADVRLELTGLPAAVGVRQLHVSLRKAEPPISWSLHPPADGRPIVVRSTGPTTADAYFDPPSNNLQNQVLVVELDLADATHSTLAVPCATATDANRKVPQAPVPSVAAVPATASPPTAWPALLYLSSGDRFRGWIVSLGEESLVFRTSWNTEFEFPLLKVSGIAWGDLGNADSDTELARRLAAPGTTDTALVRAADGSVGIVEGTVHELSEGKLRFTHQGDDRSINAARLLGIVLAARPSVEAPTDLYHVFALEGGQRLSGLWESLNSDAAVLKTEWGTVLTPPLAQIVEVVARNGRLAYLSDLEATSVVEVPYLSRTFPMRRDVNLQGQPIQVGGQTVAKGLAVHSRSSLTFAVDGRFQRFKATLGYDDAVDALPAGRGGRVDARVLGDDAPLWSQADFRATAAPIPLELDISKVRRLTLEVDFGPNEDIGDRLIWANARLIRAD